MKENMHETNSRTLWVDSKCFSAIRVFLVAQLVTKPPAMQETWVQSLGSEDLLVMRTATHSSVLAWRIQCTIQYIGIQRVRHN